MMASMSLYIFTPIELGAFESFTNRCFFVAVSLIDIYILFVMVI